jgi:S-adenosylmethionine uptake transporter
MKPASHLVPVLAAACGIATFSVMDALMKGASMQVGVFTALMGRCVMGAALSLPAWWAMERGGSYGRHAPIMGLHACRSAHAGMATLFFWGRAHAAGPGHGAVLRLAADRALSFRAVSGRGDHAAGRGRSLIALLGVGVVAAGRLGGAGRRRWLRGLVAILVSAVLYAANLVVQRHQAQRAPRRDRLFPEPLCRPVHGPRRAMAGGMPGSWPVVGTIFAAAVLASVSVALLSWGWARAQAHRLLPVEYSAFVWSALAGWWWFGEMPSIWTLGGVVLIVAGVWVGTVGRGAPDEGLPGELGASGA